MFLKLLLLLQLSGIILTSSTASLPQSKPSCEAKCGNFTIPYPFGIGPSENGCSLTGDRSLLYNVTCDTSFNPPKPFLWLGTDKTSGKHNMIELISISETELRVKNIVATICYQYKTGNVTFNESRSYMDLGKTPFSISSTKNKLFGVGCESLAFLLEPDLFQFGWCSPRCNKTRENIIEGSCSGKGCCQDSLDKRMKSYEITVSTFRRKSETLSFSPCSNAFIGESDKYTFSVSDLDGLSFRTKGRDVPVVLDWAIGNKSCENAQKDLSTFVCQKNSKCSNSDKIVGYHCNCNTGFAGNPYLSTGCE
ncbi:hypothetical protein MKW92_016633, partial [Papaver armeniacum]